MIDRHPNIRASFRNLGHAVAPPPALQDRIQTDWAPGMAMVEPAPIISLEARRMRPRRRLLDLAAVALLLLTTIGALARTTHFGSAPATPTIYAPIAAATQIVQTGGTSAQDGQIHGPAPISGKYSLAWSVPINSPDHYLGKPYIS